MGRTQSLETFGEVNVGFQSSSANNKESGVELMRDCMLLNSEENGVCPHLPIYGTLFLGLFVCPQLCQHFWFNPEPCILTGRASGGPALSCSWYEEESAKVLPR